MDRSPFLCTEKPLTLTTIRTSNHTTALTTNTLNVHTLMDRAENIPFTEEEISLQIISNVCHKFFPLTTILPTFSAKDINPTHVSIYMIFT